jgi:D-alanine-D-alanine ligase
MTADDVPLPSPEAKSDLPLPHKVAILYSDVKREYFQTEQEYISEEGADVYAGEVAKYVEKMGIEISMFPGDSNVATALQKYRPDMILNLVDSVRGQLPLGASIPGLLEVLHIPYTGTGTLGLGLNTNKFLTYQLLQSEGIPVPTHQLVTSSSDMIDPELRYPLFPKLNAEHSSIGVAEDSICHNERELRAKLKDLFTTFKQPVLIDEYISGIEVTASVLDGKNTKVYAVERKTSDAEGTNVVTFDKKWQEYLDMSYTKYESETLKDYVKEAFTVLKMSDYARMDIRIDPALYRSERESLLRSTQRDARHLQYDSRHVWSRLRRDAPAHLQQHLARCQDASQRLVVVDML